MKMIMVGVVRAAVLSAFLVLGFGGSASGAEAKAAECLREDPDGFCQRCEGSVAEFVNQTPKSPPMLFSCAHMRPYLPTHGNVASGFRVDFTAPSTSYFVDLQLIVANGDPIRTKAGGKLKKPAASAEFAVNFGSGDFDKVPADAMVVAALSVIRCTSVTQAGKMAPCSVTAVPVAERPETAVTFSAP